jgi:hypothetical protein
MAATKYTFSIQNNFPNHKVAVDRITAEIRSCTIVVALAFVNLAGDTCEIWFRDSLSGGDLTILNGIVEAHSGTPLPTNTQLVKLEGVPTTADGRIVVRESTASRTTNFKLRAISFYTSELVEGFHNVNPVTGADYGDVEMSLFKEDGTKITEEEDEVLAVKTILDFEPHYTYEIIGGFLDIPSSLKDGTTDKWFISAVGVPDYPKEMFGSIDFISEVNIEAVTTSRVTSDGRAISFLPYQYGGVPHTNRLRFTIKHPAGIKKRFQLYIEHFVLVAFG